MALKNIKDIMVPLSEYIVVSEDDTVEVALRRLRESHDAMPLDKYYHRAVLVKNEQGEIVGKLGYHGFLAALDPQYHHLEEMKTLAGSGITKKELTQEMNKIGFWNGKYPLIKQRAREQLMKQVMVKFEEHIDEEGSLVEAMHKMVERQALSLLTIRDGEITGIVRLSDLFEGITDYVLSPD